MSFQDAWLTLLHPHLTELLLLLFPLPEVFASLFLPCITNWERLVTHFTQSAFTHQPLSVSYIYSLRDIIITNHGHLI